MSGPKKADVEAKLAMAKRKQQSVAEHLSKAEETGLTLIAAKAAESAGMALDSLKQVKDGLNQLTGESLRVVKDEVQTIDAVCRVDEERIHEAAAALDGIGNISDRARSLEVSARKAFQVAESEYEKAFAAARSAGGHYLTKEMQWAQEACRRFDEASRLMQEAAAARKEGKEMATQCDQIFRETKSRLDMSLGRLLILPGQASALLAAEAVARRVTEEKLSQLLLATEWASNALDRVSGLPHEKFSPGELNSLKGELEKITGMAEGGNLDEALGLAEQLAARATALKNGIIESVMEFDRRRNEAELAIDLLASELSGIDEEFIRQWSRTPDACAEGKMAIDSARRVVEEERFEDAVREVTDCRARLAEALAVAAENSGAHGRRQEIGGEIMAVLQEMGFEVSFEDGGRDEPMRIAGLVPDVNGKGDFNISIPLDGMVDFEVSTPDGDSSCVATVNALQRRLEEQGVAWSTTDWGHAEGIHPDADPMGNSKETAKEKSKAQQAARV